MNSEIILDVDPIVQFKAWFGMAWDDVRIPHPEVMCLSTIDLDGYPDSRIVLLRGIDERGFVFFTNSESVKGRSLARVPRAAMTMYWEPLGYQVRVQGDVVKVSDGESDVYFASRPRLSQIGAWASRQSEGLDSRSALELRVSEYERQFEGRDVPRPDYWFGQRIVPNKIEFWMDRPFRLHDRFLYEKRDGDEWQRRRLFP